MIWKISPFRAVAGAAVVAVIAVTAYQAFHETRSSLEGCTGPGCGGSSGSENSTAACGNNVVEGSEQCEPGLCGSCCSLACTLNSGCFYPDANNDCYSICGDTIVAGQEECDDGNNTSGDGCSASCYAESSNKCGNGILNPGEMCSNCPEDAGNCANTCSPIYATFDPQPNDVFYGPYSDEFVCGQFALNCYTSCVVEGDTCKCTGYQCDTSAQCVSTDGASIPVCGNSCLVVSSAFSSAFSSAKSSKVSSAFSSGASSKASSGISSAVSSKASSAISSTVSSKASALSSALSSAIGDTCQLNPNPAYTATCTGQKVNGSCTTQSITCPPGTTMAAGGSPIYCTNEMCVGYCVVCFPVSSVSSKSSSAGQTSSSKMSSAFSSKFSSAFSSAVSSAVSSKFSSAISSASSASACGNGLLNAGETCDDKNIVSDDGCSSACQLERGWKCTGAPSLCKTVCGDSIVIDQEQCDDGNAASDDGCSSTCKVEEGWECHAPVTTDGCDCGTAPSKKCPDNKTSALFTCETQYDTAQTRCQFAEHCPQPSSGGSSSSVKPVVFEDLPICSTICGDGLMLGTEQCDDGNTVSGDGCSATCTCSTQPEVLYPMEPGQGGNYAEEVSRLHYNAIFGGRGGEDNSPAWSTKHATLNGVPNTGSLHCPSTQPGDKGPVARTQYPFPPKAPYSVYLWVYMELMSCNREGAGFSGPGSVSWIDIITSTFKFDNEAFIQFRNQGPGEDGKEICAVDSYPYVVGGDVDPNKWTSLAVTNDGTTLVIYVNGEVVALGPAPAQATVEDWASFCGGIYDTPFQGFVDYVHFLPRLLSPSAIADIAKGNVLKVGDTCKPKSSSSSKSSTPSSAPGQGTTGGTGGTGGGSAGSAKPVPPAPNVIACCNRKTKTVMVGARPVEPYSPLPVDLFVHNGKDEKVPFSLAQQCAGVKGNISMAGPDVQSIVMSVEYLRLMCTLPMPTTFEE